MMAMSIAALEILEEARFPPTQARALARVLEIEANANRQDLATKADLAELRSATKEELSGFHSDMVAFQSDMREEFTVLRAELAEQRQEMKMGFAALRADIAEERQARKADIADAKTDMARWTLLTMMGQTTLLAGVVYFLLQNMR